MTSETLNSELLSKFRGCLVGSLIGDCLGRPFEFNPAQNSKTILANYFSDLLSGGSTRMLHCTDDTCMTLSIARSLVENKKVDPKDMAKRFVAEYFNQPKRGYGINTVDVMHILKETNFKDVFQPAKMQFKGSGSYGNGAAMRIAPVALFGYNMSDEFLQKDVEKCSRITHHHPNGYNGAILQCLAVKAALKSDSSKEFDAVNFISQLEKKMETIESKDNLPYCESLKKIREFYLKDPEDITPEEIAECLGSIAGAYYGIGAIPTEIQDRCEFKDEIDNLAHKLYAASQETTSCSIG
ncbi:unnamed protein product [Larinioides sclopetarius]|uniref:ADP-ribosylhydrolase ARH3 n=1 Tax=Larinioides sclopetarius TaxID=280406 RepID=A0AAV2A5B4_9ARAC